MENSLVVQYEIVSFLLLQRGRVNKDNKVSEIK